jgi:TetR/AcrR family transcriptional repressor of nem operon
MDRAGPHTSSTPLRGRPRSFDVDAVTEVALLLFWEQGLEATSIEQITARTGVSGSSLYAAFGSKRGLFLAAMDRYRSFVGAAIEPLAHGGRGVDDVAEFVEWVRRGIVSDDQPSGCLVVNSMVEVGETDHEVVTAAASHREQLRSALRDALRRAERSGEIEDGTSGGRALFLEAGLFGALATGRAGARDEADAMLQSLIDEIRRWHVVVSV